MVKVTFPHIGNSYIPFRTLMSELGLEPIIPPPISQHTIALGTKIAPEFACFPMKINLGNYLEAIEAGAECIFMAGGVGPCRFGYYGEIQREILREAGINIEFLVLEAPKTHPRELWENIKKIIPKHHVVDLSKAIHLAWLKADALDRFDRLANRIRPIEKWPGTVNELQKRYYQKLDNVSSSAAIKQTRDDFLMELDSVVTRQNQGELLKLLLLGEIYMVLEPKVNFDIEKLLGQLGAEVERSIYFTDWVRDQLCLSIINPNWRNYLFKLAKPYLNNFVGGHGLETVAHTVEAAHKGFDGVIQLAPFTCMPEIVAMQVLPNIAEQLGIPVLTVIIDEHSAEAGIRTRLEAFIDLLEHRRKRWGSTS